MHVRFPAFLSLHLHGREGISDTRPDITSLYCFSLSTNGTYYSLPFLKLLKTVALSLRDILLYWNVLIFDDINFNSIYIEDYIDTCTNKSGQY